VLSNNFLKDYSIFKEEKKRKKANLKKILINQPDKIADSDEKESIELERNNY